MSFENFIMEIKKMVKDYLGQDVTVEEKSVLKNNGVKFNGIVILKENQNCVPNIYLDDYYEQYKNGRCLCDIVCEVVRYYEEHKIDQKVNIECYSKFEYVKENICFKLINYEKNKELLRDVPYIPYMDLAKGRRLCAGKTCKGKFPRRQLPEDKRHVAKPEGIGYDYYHTSICRRVSCIQIFPYTDRFSEQINAWISGYYQVI